MDMNLEVLNKITETAVRAACIRDYDIGPLKKRLITENGEVDIDLEPPPEENILLDIESCVDYYKRHRQQDSEIYVGRDDNEEGTGVWVMLDGTRTKGRCFCPLRSSETIQKITEVSTITLAPEQFEKLAKLYFGADSQFINRIRKLQWKTESDTTRVLSSVSKSADIQEIARVVDENEILFQDISLVVQTPYFVLPYETEPVEIELHIIACAGTRTFSFAPAPGALMVAEHRALQEVLAEVNRLIGKDAAILGFPTVKQSGDR